jgi:hypothetical protein
MASIFSVSPTKNVNKGLAADVNPMYPEQIAMMQQKQQQDKLDASNDRAIRLENKEWFESKKVDTEKLPEYEKKIIDAGYEEVFSRFSKDNQSGLDPMLTNPEYSKELLDLANLGERYKTASLLESDLITQSSKGGMYEPFMDQDQLMASMDQERKLAKEEGRPANFEDMADNPRNWSRPKLRTRFNEQRELQFDQEISELQVDGSDESVLVLQKYAKADIWQRNDDGSLIYNPNTKERMVKPEPTPEFLEEVKADKKYYETLKLAAEDSELDWKELAYQDFLQSNDISDVESMTRTTDNSKPSGRAYDIQDARTLTEQVVNALTPGDPSGTSGQVLGSLSNKGLEIKKDGSKIKATISKQFLNSLSTADTFILAGQMGLDINSEDDADKVKALMTKSLESGNTDINIDLSDGFNEGVTRLIRLAGMNKTENQRIAMNQYLQEVLKETSKYYKKEKKGSMFSGTDKDPAKKDEEEISIFEN